jgi:D-psicose/D-tagatose/L-ribulose 3-epimerase
MFSADNDLSSNRGVVRQAALDYVRRELDFGQAVGATYMLIVPGAVGRPAKIDDQEFHRSAEALRSVGDEFVRRGIKAAVEPIRSAEVSFCHTIADAGAYVKEVDHPGVQHINGDVYHMLVEEAHIAAALVEAGPRLLNLHLADTNRRALGEGMLDLDTIIMALYLIGFNQPGHYCTPEPLGPGGDPYPAMFGKPNGRQLDDLVLRTAETFREREEAVRSLR